MSTTHLQINVKLGHCRKDDREWVWMETKLCDEAGFAVTFEVELQSNSSWTLSVPAPHFHILKHGSESS